MVDSARGKLLAVLGMMACCGLSMAIALGLIAFSSALVISGLGVAVAFGCVAFMLAFGHRHHQHRREPEATPEHETTAH